MSLASDTITVADRVRALPIVHGSLEYTLAVRRLFREHPPAMLAVELPENFAGPLARALPFADQIPIISLSTPGGEEERPMHFIMEPLEPLVEALRSAHEADLAWHCVDLPGGFFPGADPEPFPDTYALQYLSPAEIYEIYTRDSGATATATGAAGVPGGGGLPGFSAEDTSALFGSDAEARRFFDLIGRIDRAREIHIAGQVRNLARFVEPEQYLLLVCGIKHLENVRRLIGLGEDQFTREREATRVPRPSPVSAVADLVDETEPSGAMDDFDDDEIEEEPLEALLNKSARENEEDDFELSTLDREGPEVLDQPAYFNSSWLLVRRNDRALAAFQRIALQRSAYRDAVQRYERESGELFPARREKLFFQFTRNWSLLERRLLPDLYKLVMAARGFGNDNFARIMYDTLNYLPPVPAPAFPTKRLTLDDLYKDSRLIRFRLKMKNRRRVPPPKLIRRFQKEKYPGEWREAWDGRGICSYPPEDITVEDFGRYLQQKAKSVMTGTRVRTVEFTSSLMDGIDYRETIRNLHLGKVFVKDAQNRGIDAGSVVIIFSEDEIEHDWRVVWWGEHNQESDMALYATPPGTSVIGPGICRCQYGGLMMTYPPGRLHDIWTDDFYREFASAPERLLAAALEYNEKRAVVHLSEKPPSARMQAIAGRMDQKIVHIPISTVNPVTLGRVRRFHVLDSKDRRDDAGDFIW